MEAIPYALVRNNIVFNIAMAESEDAFDGLCDIALPAAPHTAIGDKLENGVLPGPKPEPSLEERKTDVLAAIVAAADEAKAVLSRRFSVIEEKTWPQQEAGARKILGSESDVKDITARLILANEEAASRALDFVRQLAVADGSEETAFAAKIVANADQADALGVLTLMEQRGLESRVNKASSIAELTAIPIRFSILS